LATLLTTLFVDLISGILVGVLVTLVIHIIVNKSAGLFLRNIFKPNVLMYHEHETAATSNYYVSVKHFSTFLNFYKLKQQLDAVPESADVVVDFSKCEFVDNTVMENLHNYRELFTKRGGHFEVVGLDMHDTDSEHPFALRRILPIPNVLSKNLTRRQHALEELAVDYELTYHPEKNKEIHTLTQFFYFRTKQIQYIYHEFKDESSLINLFDIVYSEGAFIVKENVRSTMITMDLPAGIPSFTIDKEGFLEKFYAIAGLKDINIEGHSDFSNRFYLLGEDEEAIRRFFCNELIHFLESNPYFHIESNGAQLLIFFKERLATIKEIKALMDYGKRLQQVILHIGTPLVENEFH
jgi:hypothetical protein